MTTGRNGWNLEDLIFFPVVLLFLGVKKLSLRDFVHFVHFSFIIVI